MSITSITSSSNTHYKIWKSLLTSKGIKKEGLFILSGEKLILESAHIKNRQVVCEIIHPDLNPLSLETPCFSLTRELFDSIDELGTHSNLLVCRLPEVKKWTPQSAPKGLEVFCPLGDPQNVGALLRSCEAFGVSRVVLLEEAAQPFLPKAIKASAGSCLRLELLKGPSLSELSLDSQEPFYALDIEGDPLAKSSWPKNTRLLIGEEGPGLKRLNPKTHIKKFKIETYGVESLNAVVASSIALYHYQNRRSD